MSSSRRRPRTERRQEERALRDLARDRERLARLSPGGAADRPILVSSSAVIEVRAGSLPCPLCGGRLRLDEHLAPSAVLREVRATCPQCGIGRSLWFRVGSPLPS